MQPSIPSLSSLTGVEILLDTIQITRGNPHLKTYKIYKNNLNYSYTKGLFIGNLNLSHQYYDKPIMEDIFIENKKVIITENNQKSFQQFDIDANLGFNGITIAGIPEFLSINGGFGYSKYYSKGWNYSHKFDDFYFNINGDITYKKISLYGEYRRYKSSLFGETILKGEDMMMFGLFYNHNNLQLGAAIMYPFINNFKTGYERKSAVASVTSWEYVKETGQMVLLRCSYSFSFGRKHKAGKQKLNNQDKDAGIIKLDRQIS